MQAFQGLRKIFIYSTVKEPRRVVIWMPADSGRLLSRAEIDALITELEDVIKRIDLLNIPDYLGIMCLRVIKEVGNVF